MLLSHSLRQSFIHVTPAGAYFAASANDRTAPRLLLLNILKQYHTPNLRRNASIPCLESVQNWPDVLKMVKEAGWVCVENRSGQVQEGAMEQILPQLLATLSRERHAFLADENGLLLSYQGFDLDIAEQIAAYSAECLTSYERRYAAMQAIGLNSGAAAVVDASGSSRLGFWPLYVGGHRFALGVYGTPFFSQISFRDLVWYLSVRYL